MKGLRGFDTELYRHSVSLSIQGWSLSGGIRSTTLLLPVALWPRPTTWTDTMEAALFQHTSKRRHIRGPSPQASPLSASLRRKVTGTQLSRLI